jgi:hypothetical protein
MSPIVILVQGPSRQFGNQGRFRIDQTWHPAVTAVEKVILRVRGGFDVN